MEALQGTKRPPNTKILPIWAKFGIQVDYDVANLIFIVGLLWLPF
jgi:hypothetical protein